MQPPTRASGWWAGWVGGLVLSSPGAWAAAYFGRCTLEPRTAMHLDQTGEGAACFIGFLLTGGEFLLTGALTGVVLWWLRRRWAVQVTVTAWLVAAVSGAGFAHFDLATRVLPASEVEE